MNNQNNAVFELVFYAVIGDDQVGVYRNRSGDQWVYNIALKSLRNYNANTPGYQPFDEQIPNRTAYSKIQSNNTWGKNIKEVLCQLDELGWMYAHDVYLHREYSQRILGQIEDEAELLVEGFRLAAEESRCPESIS